MECVVGFLFDEAEKFVVLIQKTKPEWQKGLLNGIGGKIEKGETPYMAMFREFKEEAGVTIRNWKYFGQISGTDSESPYKVHFFKAKVPSLLDIGLQTLTEEQVSLHLVSEIHSAKNLIPNLKFLIPMALTKCNFEHGYIFSDIELKE